ncbi:MAG: hypothetical protein ACOVQ5_05375 [Flavobacteriales bacterium]|jgi:hypothetical protein
MIERSKNLICASLFTGAYDVNRNEQVQEDDFGIVLNWYHSIHNLGLHGVIFHNGFSQATVEKYKTEWMEFIKVDFNTELSGNAFRYLVYSDFLKHKGHQLDHVFFTDIGDVEVVKNPFADDLFLNNPSSIFSGDEPEILDNPWMRDHCEHLRNVISDFSDFEIQNKNEVLLNCGVIGGRVDVMKVLMDELANIHQRYTISNRTPFTLDMGAFNYVLRTKFSKQIIHGAPVNTVFKSYETERSDCWFRHK